ncbi:MAG: NAD-dependent epimerase/dehydratase family protein [Chloroflexota bacterium]|nr:NAD-dependent epimerase/dehydratase family protein [Chloroflexota bacterium]
MQVLVIGGTRFIGPYVVRHLSEMGHEIALFHRGQTQTDLPSGVEHILGDRNELSHFTGEFKLLSPDVVLDMFPFKEEDATAVMSTFRGIARRVVAISSMDVYRLYGRLIGTEPGPWEPLPVTEDSPLREKLYPYRGETLRSPEDPQQWMDNYDKIPVERTVMGDPALPGTILRLPMVYGPGTHRHYDYVKRILDNRPAILLDEGDARWRGPRGYVEDVALAIALAIVNDRAAWRIYNVAEVDELTQAEWIRLLGEAVGWDGKVVIVPHGRIPAGYETGQHWVVDTSRVREELGYVERTPRDEGLRRMVDWQRSHPPDEIDPSAFDYAAEDALLAGLQGLSG